MEVLEKFEREYDATIVDARENGSRAWGYADESSDIDVMALFVYNEPAKYRVLQEDTPYVVSHPFDLDDDTELVAWEAAEFGQRLVDSNVSAIDYLFSGKVYQCHIEASIESLRKSVIEDFNPIQLYHGLRGMAENNYRKYLSDHVVDSNKNLFAVQEETETELFVRERDNNSEIFEIEKSNPNFTRSSRETTVKRNLIVLRTVLRAKFIKKNYEQTGNHQLPSPLISNFIEQATGVIHPEEIQLLEELVEKKRAGQGDELIGDVVGYDKVDLPMGLSTDEFARRGLRSEEADEFIRESFACLKSE